MTGPWGKYKYLLPELIVMTPRIKLYLVVATKGKLKSSKESLVTPLVSQVQPVWDRVQSYVRGKTRCTACVVCSSLLRKYGEGSSRNEIRFHFDEYAFATVIVALDRRNDYVGVAKAGEERGARVREGGWGE